MDLLQSYIPKPLPGPEKYVKIMAFMVIIMGLGFFFTYFWGVGKPYYSCEKAHEVFVICLPGLQQNAISCLRFRASGLGFTLNPKHPKRPKNPKP